MTRSATKIPAVRRIAALLLLTVISLLFTSVLLADEPDSAYLFAYATEKNGGRNGLHFAWSIDGEHWHGIGPEYSFVRSDYGSWGSEKRMYNPVLIQDQDGRWRCIWSVNDRDGTFAYATSRDLILWKPQEYPIVNPGSNVLMPELSYDSPNRQYVITWISDTDGGQKYFSIHTKDFRSYSSPRSISESDRLNVRKQVRIGNSIETGTLHTVSWSLIEGLLREQKIEAHNSEQDGETTDQDPERFASLKPVDATITVNMQDTKPISDMLTGVFFEDINYAADGGLYAELIQNRDFEYALSDKKGNDPSWNSMKAWSIEGSGGTVSIDTINPIHPNNKHYAVLNITDVGTGLSNEGFGGIAVKRGDLYDFSFFARNMDGGSKDVLVRLVSKDAKSLGEKTLQVNSSQWKKLSTTLKADKTIPDAHLEIIPQNTGQLDLDMISLFPRKTFKGHKNGLRADLAQVIADIHPRFVRFPGGCVAHGDGLNNIYRWKNTIGPLETRQPQRNIWNYHQSAGLGYYEYFQFSEDIGAEPVPIVAAGVPCQNSSVGGAGQQCGIPMTEMDDYVQDVLDLIEWANGDKSTEWGRKRAEAGHPEPFNLKYIGIGNEDMITEVFKERFKMIYNAVQKKHPEVMVIGTVGPFYKGSDYEEGWKFATQLGVPMVDEHYYRPPGWFIHNQDFYDRYDRSKSKVYLGEYASHLPGRPTNIETALSEALYLTSVERNGDVVRMASYAPLLAKEGNTQWNPDLIYFTNTEVKPTVDYYVQKMYGNNSGDTYISSRVALSEQREAVRKRVGVSIIRDSKTGDLILKLVNMLPVAVNSNIDLGDIDIKKGSADVTVLTGDHDDEGAKPQTGTVPVAKNFGYQLPAYSFSVVRIPVR